MFVVIFVLLYGQLLWGKAKLNNTVQRFSEPSFILVCIVQGRVRGGGSKTCLITIFLVYLCVCVVCVCDVHVCVGECACVKPLGAE